MPPLLPLASSPLLPVLPFALRAFAAAAPNPPAAAAAAAPAMPPLPARDPSCERSRLPLSDSLGLHNGVESSEVTGSRGAMLAALPWSWKLLATLWVSSSALTFAARAACQACAFSRSSKPSSMLLPALGA